VELATRLLPDVVVMDVVMPNADGLTATRSVTHACPDTKVVVLSSFGERKRVTAVLRAGASGYLLKDTEPEQLAEAIRAVHRGDAVIPADQARETIELLPRLPTGTLTIVFTDIEGSTQLLERLGDERAREVVRAHDRVVRTVLARHGGVEVEQEGDAFMLAFTDPGAAVRFAVDLQRSLAAAELGVRVRAGMASGAVIAEAGGYFGRTVYMAARLARIAAGGQVLLAESTAGHAADGWPPLRDAGRHELRGLAGAHALFEAVWAAG
jgi:class 3 adenylate cyclase